MWLKQTQGQNNLLFTTIVGLKKWDTEKIGFSVKKWEEKINWNELSGEITKIELKNYEYEWQTRDVFKLYIQDINEIYVLSSSFTSVAKNMLNALANTEAYWTVTIQLYVNKAWYNSVAVRNDNVLLKRKYEPDELNKLITVLEKKNGEKINDYTDQLEFFKNQVVWQIIKNIENTKIKNEIFEFDK